MNRIELIIEDLQQARAYANDMISHVDEADWFRQPAPGVNHVAWQVGHLTVAQYGLCLKRIRGPQDDDDQLIPDTYSGLFGKGSAPTDNPDDYPSPAEMPTAD